MTERTLCFLVKRRAGKIVQVCLGMKKRGFGEGYWAGIGGKIGDRKEETIEEAARRELKEEVGVSANDLRKVAELTFLFETKQDWNQLVHVFISEVWQGDITESQEMKPFWFSPSEIPYKDMWDDAQYWLGEILKDNLLKATFTYAPDLKTVSKKEIYFVDTI